MTLVFSIHEHYSRTLSLQRSDARDRSYATTRVARRDRVLRIDEHVGCAKAFHQRLVVAAPHKRPTMSVVSFERRNCFPRIDSRHMAQNPTEQVTLLLSRIAAGEAHAAANLLPLVYDELRNLAAARMAKEQPGLTLEPTALVHEAYIRLIGAEGGRADQKWDGRAHFFGAAAIAMRRILVERARRAASLKRGGHMSRVELADEPANATVAPDEVDMVALDRVMEGLKAQDARKHEVVMLRYFAGLTIEETSLALDLSPATVKNEWTIARAWLHRELAREGSGV